MNKDIKVFKINVTYKNEGIVMPIDNMIKKGMVDIGFDFVGQGYNFETQVRDIEFKR